MHVDGVDGAFRLLYFPFTRHVLAVLADGDTEEDVQGAPVFCIDGDASSELLLPGVQY